MPRSCPTDILLCCKLASFSVNQDPTSVNRSVCELSGSGQGQGPLGRKGKPIEYMSVLVRMKHCLFQGIKDPV